MYDYKRGEIWGMENKERRIAEENKKYEDKKIYRHGLAQGVRLCFQILKNKPERIDELEFKKLKKKIKRYFKKKFGEEDNLLYFYEYFKK